MALVSVLLSLLLPKGMHVALLWLCLVKSNICNNQLVRPCLYVRDMVGHRTAKTGYRAKYWLYRPTVMTEQEQNTGKSH